VVNNNLIGQTLRLLPKLIATLKKDKEGYNVMKEQVVIDYNKNMRNIDKNDEISCQHTIVRKYSK